MPQSLYPSFRCRDAHAEISWLETTLEAERVAVYEDDGGGVAHAEMRVAGGIVMFGSQRGDDLVSAPGSFAVYVAVEDADAWFTRARDAGADVVREPFDTDYGSRDFTLRDPEGNTWHFGTYAPQ